MADKNFGDYHYFLYTAPNKAYGFRNYTDPETGQEVGYVIGYDNNNRPIYKNWMFNRDSMRQIRVSKNEKDLTGKSALDFLRNSPECKGSTSGKYAGEGADKVQFMYYFREINEAGDAKIATDTRAKSITAQAKALEIKGQELIDMCSLIGVFNAKEEIMSHRLLDYASNFPEKFSEQLVDPSRKIRSLIRLSLNKGILKQTGKMITWEATSIGADEDDAIANLMKDEKLKKAIEINLTKFGS